jgi:predicted TIM-barrel fold metal-dependent hydrolase
MTLLAEAVANGESATKNLYFDIATNVMERSSEDDAAFMAARIRQIGVRRVLYGSDGPPNPPAAEGWRVQRQKLGLTPTELQVIANNLAPYIPQ